MTPSTRRLLVGFVSSMALLALTYGASRALANTAYAWGLGWFGGMAAILIGRWAGVVK